MKWLRSWFEKKYGKKIFKTKFLIMLRHIGITKEYGRYLVHDRFLIAMFVIAFIIMYWTVMHFLVLLLAEGNSTISTTISLVGAFVGTYIAVWLHNQNHHKTIEDNYFYKLELLTVIDAIVENVIEFNTKFETIIARKDIENTIKIARCNHEKYIYRILFSQFDKLLASINSNMPAPVNVKSDVKLLIFKIHGAIITGLDDQSQQPISFGRQFWVDQQRLFNSSYFTADRDVQIQKKLKKMKGELLKIKP